MSLKIDMYISVADPAAPPPPPSPSPSLFLDQTEAPREYLRVWMTAPTPPPLSKGLDDRGPPLSQQDLDPALHFVASNLSPLWNTTLPLLLDFAQTSLFFLLISYSDRLSACRLRWREIWERDCFPIIFFVFIYILLISFFLLWVFALSLLLLGPQF